LTEQHDVLNDEVIAERTSIVAGRNLPNTPSTDHALDSMAQGGYLAHQSPWGGNGVTTQHPETAANGVDADTQDPRPRAGNAEQSQNSPFRGLCASGTMWQV
jgi:hypothetical protein